MSTVPSGSSTPRSKLDTISRDELVRFVKTQAIKLKAAQQKIAQLELHSAENVATIPEVRDCSTCASKEAELDELRAVTSKLREDLMARDSHVITLQLQLDQAIDNARHLDDALQKRGQICQQQAAEIDALNSEVASTKSELTSTIESNASLRQLVDEDTVDKLNRSISLDVDTQTDDSDVYHSIAVKCETDDVAVQTEEIELIKQSGDAKNDWGWEEEEKCVVEREESATQTDQVEDVKVVQLQLEDGFTQTDEEEEEGEKTSTLKHEETSTQTDEIEVAPAPTMLNGSLNLFDELSRTDLQADVDAAHKRVRQLATELRDAQLIAHTASELSHAKEALVVELAISRTKVEQLDVDNKAALAKIAQLADQLVDAEQRCVDLKQQNSAATSETSRESMLSLEIGDYQRTVGRLEASVEHADNTVDNLNQQLKAGNDELETLRADKVKRTETLTKLKATALKMKTELTSTRAELAEERTAAETLRSTGETSTTTLESDKVQLGELVADAEQRATHAQHRLTIAERQLAAVADDCREWKARVDELTGDFDKYKSRAESVLSTAQSSHAAMWESEKSTLTAALDQQRVDVGDLRQRLAHVQHELKAEREERERVEERFTSMQLAAESTHVKHDNELTATRQTCETQVDELRNVIRELHATTNALSVEHSAGVDDLRRRHVAIVDDLRAKIDALHVDNDALQVKCDQVSTVCHQLRDEANVRRVEPVAVVDAPVVHRHHSAMPMPPMGDQRERHSSTVNGASSASPPSMHSPLGTTTPLSQLIDDDSLSVVSTSTMRLDDDEETVPVEHVRRAQLKSAAALHHLHSMLEECETHNARLTEQADLLKEEIRRLQRNDERECELEKGETTEYLKNIVVKYLTLPSGEERSQLLPVLSTLLRLDAGERTSLKTAVQRELHTDGTQHVSAEEGAAGWSSYMPRWSGV